MALFSRNLFLYSSIFHLDKTNTREPSKNERKQHLGNASESQLGVAMSCARRSDGVSVFAPDLSSASKPQEVLYLTIISV